MGSDSQALVQDRKPTAAETEMAKRVMVAEAMIIKGWRDGKMKEILCFKYKVGYRQAYRYITRARQNLREEFGQSRETHGAASLAFYQNMQGDNRAPHNARIFARKRADELLGLDAPKRVMIGADEDAPPLVINIVPALPPGDKGNGDQREQLDGAGGSDGEGVAETDGLPEGD